MINSIALAWDKLLFCRRITADANSFLKLLLASKRFSGSRNHIVPADKADNYQMKISGKNIAFTLRRFAGDLDMFYEIFWKRVYSSSHLKNKPVYTVLDLGANIGMATAYFYSCFPGATYYCVEPDPGNMEIMKKNLAGLVPPGKIHFLQAAIGKADSKGDLITARYAYNSRVVPGRENGTIDVRSMSSVFSHFHLYQADLVKMDIEGAESDAFSETRWLEQVKHIFIECHTEELRKRISYKLEEKGFRWKTIPGNDMLVFAERIIS
jgi:FkbM family methyltransferase